MESVMMVVASHLVRRLLSLPMAVSLTLYFLRLLLARAFAMGSVELLTSFQTLVLAQHPQTPSANLVSVELKWMHASITPYVETLPSVSSLLKMLDNVMMNLVTLSVSHLLAISRLALRPKQLLTKPSLASMSALT
jgi:hypothetical protein